MDCSIYGYLSRRSKEELEHIIAMYKHLSKFDHYKDILDMAKRILKTKGVASNM